MNNETFEVMMGAEENNWLIIVNHYTSEDFLTKNGNIINFATEEEAETFVKKLNDIVNSTKTS